MAQADVRYSLPRELQGTVLESIMRSRLHEIVGAKQKWPEAAIEMALDRAPQVRSLKAAITRRNYGFIAEIKRASPSAGVLLARFDPEGLARDYLKGGACAISVVTEASHFRGRLETLADLRWKSPLPLLRKDFVVDLHQVLEARHAGADAVLLIAALMDARLLGRLRARIEALGMDALVEVHDERDLDRAIEAGATLIGVNNRDLRTFEVSLETSLRLAPRLPGNVIAVSESGIRSDADVRRLADAGFRGFLVGEALLRSASPDLALKHFVGALQSIRGRAR